jgi:hypothetical protein
MFKAKSIKRCSWLINALFFITISLTFSSCSPERRAVLRLTALNFKTQAHEAIEATKTIYKLNPNPRPPEDRREILLKRLLTDRTLDFANLEQIDKVIANTLGLKSETSPVNTALDDLKQEYIVAAETFNNIEEAGLFGTEAKAVARAAEPARRLTVKMLLLAELIRQNPPTPKSTDRVWIFYQFEKLRDRYQQSTSEADRLQIRQSAEDLLDELLTINTQEKTMVCQATAKLLLTAQTGANLSKLIENYSKLSLDEIVAKIGTALGIASSLSGSDLTTVNSKITEIQKAIQEDPVLNEILNKLPQQPWQADTPSAEPLVCS